MGLINVVVKHDGTDITNSTISYNREQDICTGIGTLELIVPLNINRTFKPWDVIEIWENGNKKAKFFLDYTSEDAAAGVIRMKATDGYKKIADYFITDSYTVDYLSYGRYWIEKFLTEAGVSYTFTVADNGSPLSNNTSMGFDSAANVITNLLQQSGWYIYFDEDGDAIVGDLNKDVNSPDHSIDSSDIQTIARELDDERLRNRAVVWGNANPTYGEVFVDISVPTPWNYDAQDKRAVVLSNSAIFSNDQALELAQMMLKEFTKIKDEKTLLVVNDYNLKIGEILKVTTKYWAGRGLITGLVANMDQNGLVYEVTLNKKCPRLFTYFGNYPDTVDGFYVYIGTAGDGIWRKYVNSSTWSNDSSGLEDLNIKDLAISNGNFAAVADDGYLYTRSSELSAWNKYTPPNLRDVSGVTYSNMDLRAVACSVDMNDNIIAGYNIIPSGTAYSGVAPISASGMSWVLQLTGAQSLIRAEQVTIASGWGINDNYYGIYDLESTGEYNIISVSGYAPEPGYIVDGVASLGGYRNIQLVTPAGYRESFPPDSRCTNRSWGLGYKSVGDCTYLSGADLVWYRTEPIMDPLTNVAWYAGSNGICKLDPNTMTVTTWNWTRPAEWANWDDVEVLMLSHIGGNNFALAALMDGGPYDGGYRLYTYTLGNSTLNNIANFERTQTFYGAAVIDTKLIINTYTATTAELWIIDMWTGTKTTIEWFNKADLGSYIGFVEKANIVSTGDSITSYLTYVYGVQPWWTGPCPFGSSNYPTKAKAEIITINVKGNGSYNITGPVLLHEEELPPGAPTQNGARFVFGTGSHSTMPLLGSAYGPFIDPSAFNGILNKQYIMNPFRFYVETCHTEFWCRTRVLNMMVSIPDCNISWSNWSDGGNWWDFDVNYEPAMNPLEWYGHYVDFVADEYGTFTTCSSRGRVWGKQASYITMQGLKSRTGGYTEENSWYTVRHWSNAFGYGGIKDGYQLLELISSPFNNEADNVTGGLMDHTDSPVRIRAPYDQSTSLASIGSFTTPSVKFMVGDYFFLSGSGAKWSMIVYDKDIRENFPEGTVLKHTSTTELGDKITATDDSLEQTIGEFEVIKTTQNPPKVDIAKGSPTVIYDIPPDDGSNTIDFWATIQNEEDTFYTHADPKPVFEARVFDLPKPGTFPTVSGEFNPKDYERYIGISNREGILASEYYLDTPWVNMVTVASGVAISGLITHFETTNYVPEGTYFFYTVSGVKSFYQKDPEASYWQDFSIGLPDSEITIIRVDDYI